MPSKPLKIGDLVNVKRKSSPLWGGSQQVVDSIKGDTVKTTNGLRFFSWKRRDLTYSRFNR